MTKNRLSFAGSQTLLASENKFISTGNFNFTEAVGDARKLAIHQLGSHMRVFISFKTINSPKKNQTILNPQETDSPDENEQYRESEVISISDGDGDGEGELDDEEEDEDAEEDEDVEEDDDSEESVEEIDEDEDEEDEDDEEGGDEEEAEMFDYEGRYSTCR